MELELLVLPALSPRLMPLPARVGESLTDLAGGSFHLDSDVGQGTTVTLHLPLCTEKESRSAAE